MVLLMSCIDAGVCEENVVGTDDAAYDTPNAMELQLNPSYTALRDEEHTTNSNIINTGHDINASHDSSIAMAANSSYVAFAEVYVINSNINDD